ncbi:hypothetical protein F511_47492 [Dorcoceras hygrometricum]|uniref:Endonuclease/exonuclease/phosphatase domain-containing protein n=1 Tax=Dorcoceras hygrometricum TaxID=472368 RepID=A0A2Z6ZQY7_9LAMI|nr:hypothetical protein F511_47492 [Dorcoceras hygrometricum]
MEPMIPLNQDYMKKLFSFKSVFMNCSNKIWLFLDESISVEIIKDHEKFLHVKMESNLFPTAILMTVVYTKCTRLLRSVLWEDLLELQIPSDMPWVIGGDFNIISDPIEYSGEMIARLGGMHDFNEFIISAGVSCET